MKELGMELANHTYSHPILTSLTVSRFQMSLKRQTGLLKESQRRLLQA